MKRLIIVAALMFAAVFTSCSKEKPIAINELPAPAQQFMTTYYGDKSPILVVKDVDDFVTTYDVSYSDGTMLEFDKKGQWIKVECNITSAVPSEIIPAEINKFVADNYPNTQIIKIEKDKTEWEIKLSNRAEFTFNKYFQLIDTDLD